MSMGFVKRVTAAAVDGSTLTAAATASCIPAANLYTFPANTFDRLGMQLHVWAAGRVSTVITTPGTVRFDLRLGGTVVWDSLAILPDTVAAHVTMPWVLDVTLTLRAVGATANFMGVGTFASEIVKGSGTMPVGSLVAMLPWNTAPVVGGNFASTAAQQLDMQFTQTVATGSLTVHQYYAELITFE